MGEIVKNDVHYKVSVIVPIYGVERYIERCARSLFEQTLDDIEFLFIDDCTPDESVGVLRRVLEEYPRRRPQVTIHRMEHNSGQAKVREWGMRNATGEYVIHCDSDDWVDTDMYRALYDKAKKEDADVVVCDYVVTNGINNAKYFTACKSVDKDEYLEEMLYQRVDWNLWNKLFKRTVYYNNITYPLYNMGEDMAICIQTILLSQKISYVPQPYYYYFKNTDSITNTFQNDLKRIANTFVGLKCNADILLPLVNSYKNPKIRKSSVGLEYAVIVSLFHASYVKKYRDMCFNTYPTITRKVLMSPKMKFKSKLKLLMVRLRLFPTKLKSIQNDN